jgi:hypothetical protein
MDDLCLYLDDNKGAPFKPVANPNAPNAPKAVPRVRDLKDWEVQNFWKEALWKTHVDYWKCYTTKVDIPVFKKVYLSNGQAVIANLIVPAGTRVHVTHSKCRAAQAKVVSMFTRTGKPVMTARSGHNHSFKYAPGQVVKPTLRFGAQKEGDCASGIHFFIDVNRARNW